MQDSELTINEKKFRIAVHCIFDGWLFSKPEEYKYYMGYSNTNNVLLYQFKDDVQHVFGKIMKERRNNHNVPMLDFGSKQAYYEIENLITNSINITDKTLQKIYLRAFFDDEGRVVYNPRRSMRRICGTNKVQSVRETAIKYLANFNVFAKENGYDVVIGSKENIVAFKANIGFTNGVKVVRLRDNSMWFGKDKNQLVDTMINTYKQQ